MREKGKISPFGFFPRRKYYRRKFHEDFYGKAR